MEPLLRGENSGRRDRPRGLRRRSDALTYGSNYEKAAALVDLSAESGMQSSESGARSSESGVRYAEDGVGLPEQILDSSSFQSYAKFYFIFTKFDLIWSLSYFALIVLNFLEKPLWCENNTTHSCKDREYFFLGELPYLTAVECIIYEGTILFLIIIHTFFPISYEGSHIYWKNTTSQLKVQRVLARGTMLDVMLIFKYGPAEVLQCGRVLLNLP
ncbi:hypothetical protein Lal_00003175 [Lupinus albus]|nr:hypothetical protein Lal_00003175 [Lupinus albus]